MRTLRLSQVSKDEHALQDAMTKQDVKRKLTITN